MSSRRYWPPTSLSTIAVERKRGDSTRSRCRDRKPAAAADVGITSFTSDVIEPWSASSARVSGGIRGPGDFLDDVLGVVEINSPDEIAAIVMFDPDDFDAAIAELDTDTLQAKREVHPHMWTATLVAYAAINRRELPATTTDFISKDHRRGAAFRAGDMIEYLRAGCGSGP